MEKEILIELDLWYFPQTTIKIPELEFSKTFRCRTDAENWAKSIFKNPRFEKVIFP